MEEEITGECKGRARWRLKPSVKRTQRSGQDGTDGGGEMDKWRKGRVVAGSGPSPVPTGLRGFPAAQVQQSSRLD